MSEYNDTEYFYYETKRPFYKTMKEFCDFDYIIEQDRRYGIFGSVNIILDIYISYDEQKLMDNLEIIIGKIKKTKAYKKCEEIKNRIDKIKTNLYDYATYSELRKDINFLIDFSIKHSECTTRYSYEIANQLNKNKQLMLYFKENIKNPIMFLIEKNGWERETWNFGIDYPTTEKELIALEKLSNRLDILGEIDQKVGKTSFHINFIPKEYEEIKWNQSMATYMNSPQYIPGNINIDKIEEWISLDNNALFDKLYKGGLGDLTQ